MFPVVTGSNRNKEQWEEITLVFSPNEAISAEDRRYSNPEIWRPFLTSRLRSLSLWARWLLLKPVLKWLATSTRDTITMYFLKMAVTALYEETQTLSLFCYLSWWWLFRFLYSKKMECYCKFTYYCVKENSLKYV